MYNKKIKNATPIVSDGIQFKSKLEGRFYNTLKDLGFNPKYEEVTFCLSPTIRPTKAFYNRSVKKLGFHYDMKPIRSITYTPDFIFNYKDVTVIIEAKGIENDSYPIKKNLFRKYLETIPDHVMYFEVRTKRELLEVIKIIKMESAQVQKIRSLIPRLPEKDIPLANKFLDKRDFENLEDLVTSAIYKVSKSKTIGASEALMERYKNIDVADLQELAGAVIDYRAQL